jgi:hypothetical protein
MVGGGGMMARRRSQATPTSFLFLPIAISTRAYCNIIYLAFTT